MNDFCDSPTLISTQTSTHIRDIQVFLGPETSSVRIEVLSRTEPVPTRSQQKKIGQALLDSIKKDAPFTSLSHTEADPTALKVIAVAGSLPVGIDLEPSSRRVNPGILERITTQRERFFPLKAIEFWVLKEAAFKANPQNAGTLISQYELITWDPQTREGRIYWPGISASHLCHVKLSVTDQETIGAAQIRPRKWDCFQIAPAGSRGDLPRSLDTPEGVGDRLRSAGFAELQAREAFRWAAFFYPEASAELKSAWLQLATAEDRHLHGLLNRLAELELKVEARQVSLQLWESLTACSTAKDFALYMASAEERGRKAGFRFYEGLAQKDPTTAALFRGIAEEEIEHIALAQKFFPESSFKPSPQPSPNSAQ